jgi:hypothetical protein
MERSFPVPAVNLSGCRKIERDIKGAGCGLLLAAGIKQKNKEDK